MEEGRRLHRFECKSPTAEYINSIQQTEFEALDPFEVIRSIADALLIAGTLENLVDLMTQNTDVSISDFDLSSDESLDLKHLKIFSSLKSNVEKKNFCSIIPEDKLRMFFADFNEMFKNKEEYFESFKDFACCLMSIRKNNAFKFMGKEIVQGSGILPFGSFFNHSCNPNVAKIQFDNKFAFVVLKPIAKDEQLFISYL
jgi:hypothetical protein